MEGKIRERERDVRDIERERVKGRGIEHSRTGCVLSYKSSGNLPSGEIKCKERLITKIMTRNYVGKL